MLEELVFLTKLGLRTGKNGIEGVGPEDVEGLVLCCVEVEG